VPGVIETRVGYTGGTTPFPTYRSIGDHTESIQILFKPKVISFDKLLDMFWFVSRPSTLHVSDLPRSNHSPIYESGCQYKSGVWYQTEAQREAFEKSKLHQTTQA
jgi:peptide methionine sulfoxide reductase MsrA